MLVARGKVDIQLNSAIDFQYMLCDKFLVEKNLTATLTNFIHKLFLYLSRIKLTVGLTEQNISDHP